MSKSAQIREALIRYAGQKTVHELAAELGCDRARVYAMARAYPGLPRWRKKPRVRGPYKHKEQALNARKKTAQRNLEARARRNAAICALAQADPALTLEQIGEKFGLHAPAICNVLRENGINRTLQTTRWSSGHEARAERNAAICQTARDNPAMTLKELGQKFGMTFCQIGKILHRNGAANRMQERTFNNSGRNAAVCAAAQADPSLSLRELGERFGMPLGTIASILQRNGIKKMAGHPARDAVIVAMAMDGMTEPEVADQIGSIGRSRIGQILQRSSSYPELIEARTQSAQQTTAAREELKDVRRKLRAQRIRLNKLQRGRL